MRKHKLGLAAFLVVMLSLVMAPSAMADPPFPNYTVTALPDETATYDFAVQAPGVTINAILGTGSCTYDSNWKVKYTVPSNAQVGDPDITCNIAVFHSGGIPGNALFTIKVGEVPPPPDTTDPEVTILSPLDGEPPYAVNSATLTYNATDDSGDAPNCVQLVGITEFTGPTVTLAEGSNTITVNCTDGAGNTGSDSVTVTYTPAPPVNLPPTVEITSPSDGTVSTSAVGVVYTAGDDSGNPPVCDRVNGAQVVLQEGIATTVTVTCEDEQGLSASDSVTVTYVPPPPVEIVVGNAQPVTELDPNQGTVSAVFPVTLSRPAETDITIHYGTFWIPFVSGQALPGSDYVMTIGNLVIPAGQTTGQISVTVKADNRREANEIFFLLSFSCDEGVVQDDHVAVGTIVNDD